MLATLIALILRIFSNPFSNVLQKKLTSAGISPLEVNLYTYAGLSFLCLFFGINIFALGINTVLFAILGGICGALGNGFLIKALECGELSVLGPINSYKAIVAMIFGVFILGEFPNLLGILGVLLIISGTYFIFNDFSLSILKRKDVRYRILALIFTATEALFIKKVIIFSDVQTAFALWCWFGTIFALVFAYLKQRKVSLPDKYSHKFLLLLIITTGVMQYSTNYVFNHMNVSYALALFQLSTILSVIFGWKIFCEKDILKKLLGSVIMFIGAVIIILA